MRPVIEKFIPDLEQVKIIRERLKECKDEWLETKPGKGNNKYIGVKTVTQILDYATDGFTYWDFEPVEQWRQEVYKWDKNTGAWAFDGYVYHVRGYLFIPGLGQRSQYGCKVAIGGKDNQDSAYKSATSNCLNKCASMFGVGSSVYDTIKIETEENDYNNLTQNPNYQVGQNPNGQMQQNNVYQYPQQQQQQWGQQQQQWGQQQYQQQQGQYPS